MSSLSHLSSLLSVHPAPHPCSSLLPKHTVLALQQAWPAQVLGLNPPKAFSQSRSQSSLSVLHGPRDLPSSPTSFAVTPVWEAAPISRVLSRVFHPGRHPCGSLIFLKLLPSKVLLPRCVKLTTKISHYKRL